MNLNDLLKAEQLDPETTLVLRHVPGERDLRKVLPWLAAERAAVFNAYQQTQSPKVEKQMQKAKYVVSFILHFREKELRVQCARTGPVRTLPVLAIESNDSKFSGNRETLNVCHAQRLIRTSKIAWNCRASRGDCRSVSNCFLSISLVIARLLSA
jgi:hypothetical protein